jgi:hypothetical protein
MSLNEEYYKSTGLHSHYKRKVSHKSNKVELAYTRKYTWFLENKIKELQKEKNDRP